MAPHQQWLSQKMVGVEEDFRKQMKDLSVKVPALKNLLDRPLDLETVELIERVLRDAGWTSTWGNPFRSLKRHGSSPECVLDLLCFLKESSDEKMQQMDLDKVTVGHLKAARSALRQVIGHVELAAKKGEIWWNWHQVAQWLECLNWSRSFGPMVLLCKLRAVDARASILMTRLEREAEKENAVRLQEANLKTKHDKLHIQVQELTHECEHLKEEESQRQAVTLQLQQLQLECDHLKKRQEESERERLKERQAVALQIEQLHLECENLRKLQEESESLRLKEEFQRQALTLQLQALQLQQLQRENDKLKKKEFKFNSLVATSLKSKVTILL